LVRADAATLIYLPIGLSVVVGAVRTSLTVDPACATLTVRSGWSSRVVRFGEVEALRLSSRGRVALVTRPAGRVLRSPRSVDTYLSARMGDRDVAGELARLIGVDAPVDRAPFALSTRGQVMLAALGAVFIYVVFA
jgi:hypothetical protein